MTPVRAGLRGAAARHVYWTEAELATLRESYARGGIAAAEAALPHRTKFALFRRAQSLGIQRRRRWTGADDRQLRRLWDGDSPLRDIAREIGRTVVTTYWRAQKLGLPLGVPDGWERLTHAAERTGFCTTQLRRVLKASGVRPRRILTRSHAGRGAVRRRQLRYMVWPADVDLAVQQWTEREPVNTAARRLGMHGEVLSRLLQRAGIRKPLIGKRHWRVTSEEVERALVGFKPYSRRGTLCDWPDCTAKHSARGYCRRHYGKVMYRQRRANAARRAA